MDDKTKVDSSSVETNQFNLIGTVSVAERCALVFEASAMIRCITTSALHIDELHKKMCDNSCEVEYVVRRELWIQSILDCANVLRGIRKTAQNAYLYEQSFLGDRLSEQTFVDMRNILIHDVIRFNKQNISAYIFGKHKWDLEKTTLYDEILTTHEFGDYGDSPVYSAYSLIRSTLANIIRFSGAPLHFLALDEESKRGE